MAKNTSHSHDSPLDEPTSAPILPEELIKQLAAHNAKQVVASAKKSSTNADNDNAPKSTDAKQQPDNASEDEDPLLDNPQTDEAVDEILKEESDTVLDAGDAETETAQADEQPEKPKRRGLWHRPWLRNTVFLLVLAGVGVAAAFPTSRYYILNKVGVRSSVSLRVIDQGTQLPLKNVHVMLDHQNVMTDNKGVARVAHVTLGPHSLSIMRIAFAPISEHVTLGWGSNPLGDFTLNPTGVKYVIKPIDYVSGKPIPGAHATSGGADAVADNNGVITLTLDDATTSSIAVDISANGYRTEHSTISSSKTSATTVVLVPSAKDVYVSKQSGTYDVMSAYVDGTGASTLLKGTGLEGGNMSLAVDNAGSMAAFVSSRDNQRDSAGDLLSTLTLVGTAQGIATTIDHAEHIQLIDWIGTSVVFQETTDTGGKSASHIVAYDYATSRRYELASAVQFSSVTSMQGVIYYAVSSGDPSSPAAYYKVNPDGTGRQTTLNKEVWSAFRVNYNTIDLQTPDGWYSYSSKGASQQISAPTSTPNYTFVTGVDSKSLWIGAQSGQSALYVHDAAADKDTPITTQDGLAYPVRWLNDTTVVYRVSAGGTAADYVANVSSGGTPRKITDVVGTYAYNN